MADPFIGEIRLYGFDYPPRDWAFCQGQQMYIQQNPALYSLIGTQYGGDGRTTYNLPNLMSRVVMGAPTPTSLGTNYASGSEGVMLSQSNVPVHAHAVVAAGPIVANMTGTPASDTYMVGAVNGTTGASQKVYSTAAASDATLNPAVVAPIIGPYKAHENRQPYLALNFCISLSGDYPPFN